MEEFKFSTIEEAVADLRAGKMIIAVDDPDRENEGDLICERVTRRARRRVGAIHHPQQRDGPAGRRQIWHIQIDGS